MHEGIPLRSKGCIAIVEPDDLIRALLERWLGEAGYRTIHVIGTHAWPAVEPQLLIADVSEPDSDGITIGALRAACAAPILALSARFHRGLGGSTEAAQRLRVAKVLPKPFTRLQLLGAVRDTLKAT